MQSVHSGRESQFTHTILLWDCPFPYGYVGETESFFFSLNHIGSIEMRIAFASASAITNTAG